MARVRYLKPGFFENEVLGVMDPLAQLLFAGLWCLADRDGRLEDRPLRIKAQVFPYRDADVGALLDTLAEAGFIARYRVNGAGYIQVVTFARHQRPHTNEAQSSIPQPPDGASSLEERRTKDRRQTHQGPPPDAPRQAALRPVIELDPSTRTGTDPETDRDVDRDPVPTGAPRSGARTERADLGARRNGHAGVAKRPSAADDAQRIGDDNARRRIEHGIGQPSDYERLGLPVPERSPPA